jgi:hypothetical protein
MVVTLFGLIIAALGGFLVFRGGVMNLLLLVMGCMLLGGSAALILPALGGSSIPPAQFALLFGVARIILPGSQRLARAQQAVQANFFLTIYCLYGVVAATFAPRFFRNQMYVPPMRGTGKSESLFETVALAPSPQNITTSVYMIGSLLAAIVAFTAMQEKNSGLRFVKMAVIIAWIHIALGVSAALLKGTPFDLFIDFMRNANYTQTDQTVFGLVRLTGIFTEPSAYASFAFGWFVFLIECWLRDVLPRRTGWAAAAMGTVLFCSTSSTAYVALGGYAAIFCFRLLLTPRFVSPKKGLALGGVVLLILILSSAAAFLFPSVLDLITTILQAATVGKQNSDSALQRGFWARSGLDAFVASYGVGIGPGSFRSSSFATAMLGSVGVIGTLAMAGHLVRTFKPLRISTYCGAQDASRFGLETMIGAAAGWAAVSVLIPASVASPTCDPGTDFAIFTAVALALRRPLITARQRNDATISPNARARATTANRI